MYKIFKNAIDTTTIDSINRAIDIASDGGFEVVMPPKSKDILEKFRSILLSQCANIRWDDKSYVVIRTVTNEVAKDAQCWHFDNFRDTVLVVLKSTEGTENGDLFIRSDLRKSLDSLSLYIITKVFWTNPITWFFLRIKFIRDRFFTRIPLKAGDVMMFDGATTLHGNLSIMSGTRRSILIHNKPPFENSWFTKLFHKLNQLYYKK